MEHWLRQLLVFLSSIGWLLSLVILAFIAQYYIDATNPLRKEALIGATIPVVYGFPVWAGLIILLLWKREFISKRERNLSVVPLIAALAGFLWSFLLS